MKKEEGAAGAWLLLGRVIDMGYAVALRKNGGGIHVRAVRKARVSEADCPTMSEALEEIYKKVLQRKAEVGSP